MRSITSEHGTRNDTKHTAPVRATFSANTMHRDCTLRSQTLVRSSAVTVISRPRDYVHVLRPRIFYTPPPATLSSVRADCLSFNRLTVPTTPSYASAKRTGWHSRRQNYTVIAHHQQPRFNSRFSKVPLGFSPPFHMFWVWTFGSKLHVFTGQIPFLTPNQQC